MTPIDILLLNFEEIRRRSINIWNAIPPDCYTWRPDKKAMSCLEMVRHVLEGEHLFHQVANNRGNLGHYPSPWNNLPYSDVAAELVFALPYRQQFIKTVQSFTPEGLDTINIIRTEAGQKRKLGDYLLRIGYHESVHAGQLLSYLRTLQAERPNVWD